MLKECEIILSELIMASRLYEMNIDDAFEDAIGNKGAAKERYGFWLDKLSSAIPRIKSHPQVEAASVFSLPSRSDDLADIESMAGHIAGHFHTLVVAGMGGSSLSGETLLQLRKTGGFKLHFLDNIDPYSMDTLVRGLDWPGTAFLVISKSGNTLETLAQMAILLRMAKAHTKNASKHFFVITIPNNNPLHAIAKANNMQVLAHDTHLGGRFSILSSVGLVPAAAAGIDIRALRAGAQAVLAENFSAEPAQAPAAMSAALHLALMEKDIGVNVMMHYCDRLGGLANWYRQCWGESLGKCDTATTPVPSRNATDQHSQLQLYLDGPKDKFFTMMMLDSSGQGAPVDFGDYDDARLAFMKGRTLGDVMVAEQNGTLSTLIQRGCPTRSFTLKTLDEEVMGALLMHFALEVIFTAELLGVNAFDQPAVEDGKVLALKYLADAA